MYLLHILIIIVCFRDIYSEIGGYITIINETESDWKLIEQKSNNMNSWDFPKYIRAGEIHQIYVEWLMKTSLKSSEMNATAAYSFVSAEDKKFVIQVADFKTAVFFHNISIDGKPGNDTCNLGLLKNEDVTFVLVEYLGNFSGSGSNATDWMRNNIDMLGKRTLMQITIPGTHNSGMNIINKTTLLSDPCNIQTQSYSIKGQLNLGIRYFDIRPILTDGIFMTGHFEKIPGSWQGGVGQSIKSIVDEINEFTLSHCEVIIISLSHSLNTEKYIFRKFNQSEWEKLFNSLDRIKYLFHTMGNIDITGITINEFTSKGNSSAVIIQIRDKGVALHERWGKGYFYHTSFKMYDNYSNTNNLVKMAEDQIIKMRRYSINNFFLLSWTLTQSINNAVLCQFRVFNNIKDLAQEANRFLAYIIYPHISHVCYPNIICIDDVRNREVAALAIAINKKLLRN